MGKDSDKSKIEIVKNNNEIKIIVDNNELKGNKGILKEIFEIIGPFLNSGLTIVLAGAFFTNWVSPQYQEKQKMKELSIQEENSKNNWEKQTKYTTHVSTINGMKDALKKFVSLTMLLDSYYELLKRIRWENEFTKKELDDIIVEFNNIQDDKSLKKAEIFSDIFYFDFFGAVNQWKKDKGAEARNIKYYKYIDCYSNPVNGTNRLSFEIDVYYNLIDKFSETVLWLINKKQAEINGYIVENSPLPADIPDKKYSSEKEYLDELKLELECRHRLIYGYMSNQLRFEIKAEWWNLGKSDEQIKKETSTGIPTGTPTVTSRRKKYFLDSSFTCIDVIYPFYQFVPEFPFALKNPNDIKCINSKSKM